MGKFCIKILIIGLIMTITGTVTLAVELINGYIDEVPSLTFDDSSSSGEYAVTTTFLTEVSLIDEGYSDYSYYEVISGANANPDEINELDIAISMGIFEIVPGDSFKLMANGINADYLKFAVSGDRLEVKYSPDIKLFDFSWMNDSPEIVLFVPQKVYENISIDMDAGTINVTELSANDFTFDMSAGEAYITAISAYNSSDIKMSAGYSAFTSCNLLNSSNIKVSAGNMEFENSSVTGSSEIKVSAGTLYMNLTDDFSLYNISAERSAGEIYINDEPTAKKYGSYAAVSEPIGEMDVKVSAGSCYIFFEEE